MITIFDVVMYGAGLYGVYSVFKLVYLIGKYNGVKEYEQYKEEHQ